ncbi:hypothetical protein C0992_003264, partial [Termitomyces sp. T32_za158]
MGVPTSSDKGLVDVSGDEHDTLLVTANPTVEPPPPFYDNPQDGPSHLVGSAAGALESPP